MQDVVTRYWHTVRYLKPVQIVGRLRMGLWTPHLDVSKPAPPRRRLSGEWRRGIERPPALVGPWRFRFLNQEHDAAAAWDDPSWDKLWRYNLHYFDDLNAAGSSLRQHWHHTLLARWVRDNPPTTGTGWEPYPTSLRIVNWTKWALAGNELGPDAIASLALQARWLSKRLEFHLLGNHLLANAKALVFAGLFFEGNEARRWLETGCEVLLEQIREQVLPDGGHFELSPMYHAIALEDMLDLYNVSLTFAGALPGRWASLFVTVRETVPRMARWLLSMTHPDGDVAFFNDTTLGIAPTCAQLSEYAARLGITAAVPSALSLEMLANSGYARMQRGDATVFLDVGRVGPDYLPGHSHADTLSFECSLRSQRVIVNSGISVYGNSAERLRQRGTAAHSTVVVDGADSSEVWSGFRVARRARPEGLAVLVRERLTVRCSHDGFRRLPGRPTHTREWTLDQKRLQITDTVAGRFRRADARFHLHPDIAVRFLADERSVDLLAPDGHSARLTTTSDRIRVEPSSWHPEFGVAIPSKCIVVSFMQRAAQTQLQWV